MGRIQGVRHLVVRDPVDGADRHVLGEVDRAQVWSRTLCTFGPSRNCVRYGVTTSSYLVAMTV